MKNNNQAGKGDSPRAVKGREFRANYDYIFRNKKIEIKQSIDMDWKPLGNGAYQRVNHKGSN
jgi:hypothetical protein